MTPFPGPQAAGWWRDLQHMDKPGERPRGDRGSLARLRRCASVMEAAMEPSTLGLCRRLGTGEAGLERAALLAAVLGHVREERTDLRVARQLGAAPDGQPVLSDLRFRRLLQADTPDEQLIAFRRLVALAGRRLDIADLAVGLWHWNEEATRQRWIYAYHDAPTPIAAVDTASDAPPPVIEDTAA